MAEQDIFGHWRRALTDAIGRMTDEKQIVSAAQEVKQITLADGRQAIIFVKVIEFDAAKLLLEPGSGGLLASL
jgi:hypothetical protein